jgi:hypothetical protein
MISHFKKFWNGGRSAPKFIERINEAVDRRAKAVFDGYKSNPDTVARRTEEFEKVMVTVREDADAFAKQLADVKDNQFFFGFHAHPDTSVGHLHMHVLLGQSKFRTYSTGVHDWKTIPAQAVITVIRREKPRRFQDLVLHLIHVGIFTYLFIGTLIDQDSCGRVRVRKSRGRTCSTTSTLLCILFILSILTFREGAILNKLRLSFLPNLPTYKSLLLRLYL